MSLTPPVALATAALGLFAVPARAQTSAAPADTKAVDDKAFKLDAPGFYANADLSYVLTSGNSSSRSLGFKGDVGRRWTKQGISFAAGGIRASSSPDSRYAVGTPTDFDVRVPDPQPTAEAYYARGRYDYKLSDRVFTTVGAGWERNRFSGIQNRWVGDAGFGYLFVNSDATSYRAALGVTYTDEAYTVGGSKSFVGARLGWDFRQKLFPSTTFSHTFIGDQSLEDSTARRFDAQFGLQVAMTKGLGLKVNWRILYNNDPPLAEVPLFTPGGISTGLTVLAPYKKTDQGFSVSLVLSLAPAKKS